jgi:hypothetical protein
MRKSKSTSPRHHSEHVTSVEQSVQVWEKRRHVVGTIAAAMKAAYYLAKSGFAGELVKACASLFYR